MCSISCDAFVCFLSRLPAFSKHHLPPHDDNNNESKEWQSVPDTTKDDNLADNLAGKLPPPNLKIEISKATIEKEEELNKFQMINHKFRNITKIDDFGFSLKIKKLHSNFVVIDQIMKGSQAELNGLMTGNICTFCVYFIYFVLCMDNYYR